MGLNLTLSVIRRTGGPTHRDSSGGSVPTESTVATGIACRLGNASRSAQTMLREYGYEGLRAHEIIAQPGNLDVQENDHVLMSGGYYDGQRLIVRSVRRDNLPSSDPRSHVELLVERLVEARVQP